MLTSSSCPSRFFWPMFLVLLFAVVSIVLYSTISPSPMKQEYVFPQPAAAQDYFLAELQRPIWKVTSAYMSTYRLVNKQLRVGDTVHFVIQAKDAEGKNKTSGGDFWFAVLTSVDGDHPTAGWRTAGSVVDHQNGTYSVFFYAGWAGVAYVDMKLAAPSHATKWLQEKYWPVEKRVFWKGEFWGLHSIETAVCFVQRNVTSTSALCTIDHTPRAMGLTALYCEKPLVAKCEDFKMLYVDPELVNRRTLALLQDDIALFQGENYLAHLSRGPQSVTITKPSTNRTTDTELPVCQPDDKLIVNHGFWLDAEWHHLQCKVHRWNDVNVVRQCLRNKHVFFHGDSNIRNWYCILAKKLGYAWRHLGSGKDKMIMHHYYADSLIETSFYFHPRVITNSRISLDDTPYEVDILDNIKSNECDKYIIVLCPWGHFTQWTLESFTERINLLKEAVLRLLERCPDVPVVLKGTHAREHETTLKVVFASDYTLWRLGRILRDTFRGTGVHFYDVWQMNLAYGKPDIHMPIEVIDEEVNWFLSYVCR